ncbi:MAG: undecaprenyldiphospho-muramoylpentapeptide beta-N-acetylglucosaminyltransferase [Candidatus Amulumruptor caecigallinarius]|nr:undecaprenyldiphospho-muramoylpentapeptide beta-N-acetylglucosaminyltransferase [Candidatus Amulumruptor caecigallinarius]
MKNKYRILISGGGTGGHIFPALSIANALKRRVDADILFVGAENRMEMEKVPAAGYPVMGLPVAGFDRKRLWRNFGVLVKLRKSMSKAKEIVKEFKPDIAIGVGGYCSGPTLKAAQKAGVPTLLQEQNSYAGVTNKLLAKKARKICVAYDNMERFFPAEKIIKTGNPVRKDLSDKIRDKEKARQSFGLDPDKATIFVTGGSLGALTINESVAFGLRELTSHGYQVILQTGKSFAEKGRQMAKGLKGVVVTPFVSDMGSAYAAADLVVSRAGAGSISELELLGKPCILVPSPNVAEDHQTKNAQALVNAGAAVMVADADARRTLVGEIIRLMGNKKQLAEMSQKICSMSMRNSDELIVDEILKIIGK